MKYPKPPKEWGKPKDKYDARGYALEDPRRWIPIRRRSAKGTIYCSPGCGFNCTQVMHDKAQADAAKLVEMIGPGWTTRVWENMGWHYSVISPCERIKVHPDIDWQTRRPTSYTAYLGEPGCGGRWSEHGRYPKTAIRRVIRVAKADLARIGAYVEGL